MHIDFNLLPYTALLSGYSLVLVVPLDVENLLLLLCKTTITMTTITISPAKMATPMIIPATMPPTFPLAVAPCITADSEVNIMEVVLCGLTVLGWSLLILLTLFTIIINTCSVHSILASGRLCGS